MEGVIVIRGLLAVSILQDGKRTEISAEYPSGLVLNGFATTTGVVRDRKDNPLDICTMECFLELPHEKVYIIGRYSQNKQTGVFVQGELVNANVSMDMLPVMQASFRLIAKHQTRRVMA